MPGGNATVTAMYKNASTDPDPFDPTPPAQKDSFKLWGKVTKWEKTPLNWFLLIVAFGWIWMSF
jgi:hypothetical protein